MVARIALLCGLAMFPAVSQAAKDFFVEVHAQPRDPYVQAQVLFTLKVFMLHRLNGTISRPQGDSRLIVQELGNPRNYRIKRDGRHYQVHEMRYLMHPQKSDQLKIKPAVLDGVYVKGGRRHKVNTRSPELTLNVRPPPDSFPGKFWLPAAQLKLGEDWSSDPSSWRAGEPIERTIRLEATGLLAKQLPEVELPSAAGFRTYPEPSSFNNEYTNKGTVGQHHRTMVLIPAQAGSYTLPGVRLPWWNTRTNRLEFAELPPRAVTVGEAEFSSLTVDEPSTVVAGEAAPTVVAHAAGAGFANLWVNPWVWVSAALLTGWLVTALMAWRGVDWYRTFRRTRRRRMTMDRQIEVVRRACKNKDTEAARDALMAWARLQWPSNPPLSLGGIGVRCGGVLGRHIQILEAVLYRDGGKWPGSGLWDAFSTQEIDDDGEIKPAPDGLEPLHRL